MSDSLRPHGLYSPWNSPGQNTAVGSHSLLQGIFPTQELNRGLLHCRLILNQRSYPKLNHIPFLMDSKTSNTSGLVCCYFLLGSPKAPSSGRGCSLTGSAVPWVDSGCRSVLPVSREQSTRQMWVQSSVGSTAVLGSSWEMPPSPGEWRRAAMQRRGAQSPSSPQSP